MSASSYSPCGQAALRGGFRLDSSGRFTTPVLRFIPKLAVTWKLVTGDRRGPGDNGSICRDITIVFPVTRKVYLP